MKKYALPLLLFSSLLFLCFQCENDDPEGRWYVKNRTDRTLILAFPSLGHTTDKTVAPGDSVAIFGCRFREEDELEPYFDLWPLQLAVRNNDRISLNILSEDRVGLKTWDYAAKDRPGKQPFSESAWQHYTHYHYITDVWVFDILPEDIGAAETPDNRNF